ncbi:MAG: acyltransferase [Isosphaeraceae bacterium]|nr:acyltransferase [Isosphaeraceae bacterium]
MRLPNAAEPTADRLSGLDTMRVLAVCAVIAIHFPPVDLVPLPWGLPPLGVLIAAGCRFAVPFFFISSGFFLGRRYRDGRLGLGYVARRAGLLYLLYAIWTVVYCLIPERWDLVLRSYPPWKVVGLSLGDVWSHARRDPLWAALKGPAPHLWFLSALSCETLFVWWLARYRRPRLLVAVGVVFYVVVLLLWPYRQLLGLAGPAPAERIRPLVAPLFVGIGFCLGSRVDWIPRRTTSCLLLLAGATLNLVELAVLYGWDESTSDYAVFTPLYGLGAFLFAWTFHDFGASTHLPIVGRYVLGIYALHVLIGGFARGLLAGIHLAGLHIVVTVLLCWGIAAVICRSRRFGWMVR